MFGLLERDGEGERGSMEVEEGEEELDGEEGKKTYLENKYARLL